MTVIKFQILLCEVAEHLFGDDGSQLILTVRFAGKHNAVFCDWVLSGSVHPNNKQKKKEKKNRRTPPSPQKDSVKQRVALVLFVRDLRFNRKMEELVLRRIMTAQYSLSVSAWWMHLKHVWCCHRRSSMLKPNSHSHDNIYSCCWQMCTHPCHHSFPVGSWHSSANGRQPSHLCCVQHDSLPVSSV